MLRSAINKEVTMASLAAQLPALIGVLIGAAAAYAATFATDRTRWRREQSVRWDVKRADAYAEYGFAVKKVITLAVAIAGHSGAFSVTEPLTPAEGVGLLADAEHERAMKWETVLLLGSDEVVEAARRWHRSVFRLQEIARGYATADGWDEAVKVVSRERGRFYEAARRDLGLRQGNAAGIYDWHYSQSARASREARISPSPEPHQSPGAAQLDTDS